MIIFGRIWFFDDHDDDNVTSQCTNHIMHIAYISIHSKPGLPLSFLWWFFKKIFWFPFGEIGFNANQQLDFNSNIWFTKNLNSKFDRFPFPDFITCETNQTLFILSAFNIWLPRKDIISNNKVYWSFFAIINTPFTTISHSITIDQIS